MKVAHQLPGVSDRWYTRNQEKSSTDLAAAPLPRRRASQFPHVVQASLSILLVSSRRSQTFDKRQSRFTVSGETFSVSAVSWILSPPKKRSSTTWLRRGSTDSNAVSASSRAAR